MVEALVVKIFYFVVAIFSVVMIFLAAQDPYLANVLKIDTKISNMQINDEVIYGTKTKIVRSEANFTLIRNNDKALGESGSYDLGKKQTQVKGLRAWVEENQRF